MALTKDQQMILNLLGLETMVFRHDPAAREWAAQASGPIAVRLSTDRPHAGPTYVCKVPPAVVHIACEVREGIHNEPRDRTGAQVILQLAE